MLVSFMQGLFAQLPGGVDKPEIWAHDTASVSITSGWGLTYVGVSKIVNDREQAVWSLENGDNTTHIQTTARAADLNRGTFMNYAPDSLPELRLYSYTASSRSGGAQKLHIGHVPNGKFPVKDMDGSNVECVVYNRSLSPRERCRVESYMALKYGVSLRGSYLNSRGTAIWDADANRPYCHRIAGIIADSLSALSLTRARSSEDGHFLTVGTTDALSDGQSLLWGDDNGKLAFVPGKAYGKWLGRKWQTAMTGMDGLTVDMTADISQLRQIQPLSEGESYYLAVDPTGTGRFPVRSLRYRKADPAAGDSIVFTNIRCGEKDVFTFRAAKDMFTTIEVRQPGETDGITGSLDVLATGGTPPYRMHLKRENVPVYDRTRGDSLQTIDNLTEGIYLLTTTDKAGNISEHEFQISMTGVTELPSDGITDDGDAFFARVSTTPNPTSDGHVRVQVELGDDAPLDMVLYTMDGARISSISLPADSYFATGIYLPSSGVCLLTLKSGTHEKTVKLMRL